MKIIIDVPDDIYNMVINTGTYGQYRFNSTKAIKDGVAFSDKVDEIVEVVKSTILDSFMENFDEPFTEKDTLLLEVNKQICKNIRGMNEVYSDS
jgi:hypothetical protein